MNASSTIHSRRCAWVWPVALLVIVGFGCDREEAPPAVEKAQPPSARGTQPAPRTPAPQGKHSRLPSKDWLPEIDAALVAEDNARVVAMCKAAIRDGQRSATIYASMAKSLAALNDHSAAAAAYHEAAERGHELAPSMRYEAAVMHAEAGDEEAAFKHLTAAIQGGFHAFDHMRKDRRLYRLRAHPDWTRTIEGAMPPEVTVSPLRVHGRFSELALRVSASHTLCEDGTYRHDRDGFSAEQGRWSIEEGALVLSPKFRCQRTFAEDDDDGPGRRKMRMPDGPWECGEVETGEAPRELWSAEDLVKFTGAAQGAPDDGAMARFNVFTQESVDAFCEGKRSLEDMGPDGQDRGAPVLIDREPLELPIPLREGGSETPSK